MPVTYLGHTLTEANADLDALLSAIPANRAGVTTLLAYLTNNAVYNVKDIGGAKGDGVTDDTAAIQAALNAVPTQANSASIYQDRGAIALIPPGTFILSSKLTLPRGVTLMGAGSEATELRYNQPTGDVLFYEAPNTGLSILPKIAIKGLRVTVQGGVTHTSGALVHIDSADPTPTLGSRVELEDVQCWYGYNGFYIRNVQGGSMRFCNANYSGSSNFVFRGFATMFHAHGCWASAAGQVDKAGHGWDISGWAYCSAISCGSDSNKGRGWYVKQQAGDQSMHCNLWNIGSEGSTSGLFYFSGQRASQATLFGIAPAYAAAPTLTPSAAGGTLATGTYYYLITALYPNGAELPLTAEGSCAVTGPTGSVALAWAAAAGASGYRVYRGTAASGESVYYAPGNVTNFTDTGAAGTAATPPLVDGATFDSCTAFRATPEIQTQATATGYPVRFSGTLGGTIVDCAAVGSFNNGQNQFIGLSLGGITLENLGATFARVQGGGVTDTVALSAGVDVVNFRTGAAGTAGKVLSDKRVIPTDNKGSQIWRRSSDDGSSFTQIHINSLVGGPYLLGSFGDGIFESTQGNVGEAVKGKLLRYSGVHTYAAAVAAQPLDASLGHVHEILVGSDIAVVVQAPTNAPGASVAHELLITIFNTFGGVLTTAPTFATGAGAFVLSSAAVNPGNGTGVTYRFAWSPNYPGGARYREVSRTVAF